MNHKRSSSAFTKNIHQNQNPMSNRNMMPNLMPINMMNNNYMKNIINYRYNNINMNDQM